MLFEGRSLEVGSHAQAGDVGLGAVWSRDFPTRARTWCDMRAKDSVTLSLSRFNPLSTTTDADDNATNDADDRRDE